MSWETKAISHEPQPLSPSAAESIQPTPSVPPQGPTEKKEEDLETRPCTIDPRCRIREDGVIFGVRGKPLTQHPIGNTRYLVVTVKLKKHLVSRLVALAFIGQPKPEQTDCAHEDGNKHNNHWRNLRWDTRQGNEADKIKHGRTIRGTRHPLHKLTEEIVLNVRKDIANGMRVCDAAQKYGISAVQATKLKLRHRWKHI